MRWFFTKLLLWMLGWEMKFPYDNIKEDVRDEWLMSLMVTEGFKEYFRYRDLQLLKILGNGQDERDYWMTLGKRGELLYLLGLANELFKKAEIERKKANKDNEK